MRNQNRGSQKFSNASTLAIRSTISIEERKQLEYQGSNALKDRFSRLSIQDNGSKQQNLAKILNRIVTRKKRFSFQAIKQFYLFPDESVSMSLASLNSYDPLIFNDEALHTLSKIVQTKLGQRLIWGFINLKAHRKLKLAKQLASQITKFARTTVFIYKSFAFTLLKDWNMRYLSWKNNQLNKIDEEYSKVLRKNKSSSHLNRNVVSVKIHSTEIKKPLAQKIEQYAQSESQTQQFHQQVSSNRITNRRRQVQYVRSSPRIVLSCKNISNDCMHDSRSTITCSSCCHSIDRSVFCSMRDCYNCCECFRQTQEPYNLGSRIQYLKHLEQMAESESRRFSFRS